MIKYTIQEIIDWAPSFFSPGDTHTKGMLFVLHLVLKVSGVDTDPERRFVSFKATTSNASSVCGPSGYSTREQLASGCFFEGLQNYT